MPRISLLPRAWRELLALSSVALLTSPALAQEPPAPEKAPPPAEAPATGATGAEAPAAGASETLDLTAPPPAPPADPNENPYLPVTYERRGGLVLGVHGGLALTSASGTRVKFSLRDQTAEPGLAAGYAAGGWIGGSFTDWFTFRVGGSTSSANKSGLRISGSEVLFGVDVWPLVSRGGFFRDLGLGLDFGTGSASIVSASDDLDIRAQGGGFSMVRLSAFYEPTLFWKIHGGPALSYERRSTETYTEHLTMLGARIVFYGGP
jgi:hypothetical protein